MPKPPPPPHSINLCRCEARPRPASTLFKRALLLIAVVVLILLARPVYETGVDLNLWQPLTRPAGVSPQVRYVSTLTDAAWFECSVDDVADVDVCRAWDERGHLIAHGRYRLDGESRAATPTELRPSEVQEYPGHPELAWIYLSGSQGTLSKILVPVNSAAEPLERFEVHVGGESH